MSSPRNDRYIPAQWPIIPAQWPIHSSEWTYTYTHLSLARIPSLTETTHEVNYTTRVNQWTSSLRGYNYTLVCVLIEWFACQLSLRIGLGGSRKGYFCLRASFRVFTRGRVRVYMRDLCMFECLFLHLFYFSRKCVNVCETFREIGRLFHSKFIFLFFKLFRIFSLVFTAISSILRVASLDWISQDWLFYWHFSPFKTLFPMKGQYCPPSENLPYNSKLELY